MSSDRVRAGTRLPIMGLDVADRRRQQGFRLKCCAATALCAAGGLHLAAALDYLGHDVRYFVFLVAVGTMQVLAGPRLSRPVRARTGVPLIAATVPLLLLDLYSHIVGLPLGPHAGEPWGSDLLGLGLTGCEVVGVVGTAMALPPRARSWTGHTLAVAAACLWALLATSTVI